MPRISLPSPLWGGVTGIEGVADLGTSVRTNAPSPGLVPFEGRGGRHAPHPIHGPIRSAGALRLLCLLAMGTMLAACGRCGDFVGQSQIGACHSDPPPQQ